MIDTTFDNETAGQPVQSSPRWDLGDGAASGLEFVSAGGGAQVKTTGGSSACVHTTAPEWPHQRAEVQVKQATAYGGTATSGLVVRYRDQDNMVYCVYHHDTKLVHLVERLAAVETVLVEWPAPSVTSGLSIAVEAIGRRARLWVEPHPRPVADRPPDAAGNLSSEGDEEAPGGWGLLMNSDTPSNDMRVVRFQARDLPGAALPAPSFTVSDATAADLNLVPVRAVAGGVSGAAVALEWEVYPADPDDYPEAYTDVTRPSTTTRVFFVRPGYPYDFRVREVLADGFGDWSTFVRLTATGSKSAPAPAVMPTAEYPALPPDYVMPMISSAAVVAVVSETGRERVHSPAPAPRIGFKLSYKNRQGAEIQTLIDFFDRMSGKRQSFKWTHPTTGVAYAMRFDSDDYEIEYGDRGDAGVIASFELQITEVWLGSVGTLAANLDLDPVLT